MVKLESIDSKQIVKNLTAAQKLYLMDFFVTFTCNKKTLWNKPIKQWIDSEQWGKHYPNFHSLTDDEKNKIQIALNQSSSILLLRAWKETCNFYRLLT